MFMVRFFHCDNNTLRFTCYVVDRVESDPKPANFIWVVAFDAPAGGLDPLPVLCCELCIVEGIQSRTCSQTTTFIHISSIINQAVIYN
jgi:hypothetical protein